MWEKFTSSAKRVIKYAHEEALHHNNDYVGTEHLLAAILKDENSFAVKALRLMDMDIEKIRGAVLSSIPFENFNNAILNFSRAAKSVLEAAYKEA